MSTPMIHLHPLVADEMRVPIQIEHLVASWKLKARAAAVCLDLHHPAEEAVGRGDYGKTGIDEANRLTTWLI